jgi:hypothetical protein
MNLESYVPTVLCLCRGDPQLIRELMEMALAAATPAAVTPATQGCEFPYSQKEASRIVCAAHGRKPDTFKTNEPWRLLEKNGMGEGIGFSKPRPTSNGGKTRDYSKKAVDFLCLEKNWKLTRSMLVKKSAR